MGFRYCSFYYPILALNWTVLDEEELLYQILSKTSAFEILVIFLFEFEFHLLKPISMSLNSLIREQNSGDSR